MNVKKKLAILSVVMIIVFGLGFASIPTAKAQFVLAWDYGDAGSDNYDEYGQGLYMYVVLENATDTEWTPV